MMAKEVGEMNAARLMRLLKSIPSICMNEEVVKSVSSIPINKRVHFGLGVDLPAWTIITSAPLVETIKAELNKNRIFWSILNDNTALKLLAQLLALGTIRYVCIYI